MKLKAVVFDRDGTLNHNESRNLYYVTKPEELELFEGVKETLTLLRKNNILPFVFTQQNGISKPDWPQMTEAALLDVHEHMQQILGENAKIEKFYFSPSPDDAMAKPGSGMLEAIMQEYTVQASEMLVIGDSKRDYEAAHKIGAPFVLMQLPGEKICELESHIPVCKSFDELRGFLAQYF